MKRYQSKYAVCPFYHSEDSHKIYCEGVDKNTSIHLAFGDSAKRKEYRQKHCECFGGDCMIRKMLFKKYEEKEE